MAREPHFVVKYSSYVGTAIKLVLYILKQLFASVSVNSGGYLPRQSGSVNIHRYSPPLRRIIVKYHNYISAMSALNFVWWFTWAAWLAACCCAYIERKTKKTVNQNLQPAPTDDQAVWGGGPESTKKHWNWRAWVQFLQPPVARRFFIWGDNSNGFSLLSTFYGNSTDSAPPATKYCISIKIFYLYKSCSHAVWFSELLLGTFAHVQYTPPLGGFREHRSEVATNGAHMGWLALSFKFVFALLGMWDAIITVCEFPFVVLIHSSSLFIHLYSFMCLCLVCLCRMDKIR